MATRASTWKPSTEQRNLVASLTAFGMQPAEQTILIKGPNDGTLSVTEFCKIFAEEIRIGRAKANAQLGRVLFERALSGNSRALREWHKLQAQDGTQPDTVPTRELQTWLGLSQWAIADMEKRGVIAKVSHGQYPLRDTVLAVMRHYREVAAGRTDADPQSGGALVTERARLAHELADQASMRNAAMRGEMVYVRDIIGLLHECNRTVTTRILSLPSEASPQLHACRTVLEHQMMMRALLSEALEGLCKEFGSERRGNGSAEPPALA